MESQKGENKCHDYKLVRITEAGPVTEVMKLSGKSKGNGLKKLNADEYLNVNTGEVKEYQHTDNRAQNIGNVKRTLRQIRLLVNANVLDVKNILWVTLTYAENMTDTEKLYHDFKNYVLRLYRWCGRNGYQKPEYICVVEPQGRGAWHCHVFLIWPTKAPFMDNNTVMEKLWPYGWTKTKKLNDVDNIGAYFSAYLADIPLEEAEKLPEEEFQRMKKNAVVLKSYEDNGKTIKDKKFIKGGRLYLYPTGMSILRHSKGIKNPSTTEMEYKDYQQEISGKEKSLYGTQTFSSSTDVMVADGSGSYRTIVQIGREYYNTNRKEKAKLNESKGETKDEIRIERNDNERTESNGKATGVSQQANAIFTL